MCIRTHACTCTYKHLINVVTVVLRLDETFLDRGKEQCAMIEQTSTFRFEKSFLNETSSRIVHVNLEMNDTLGIFSLGREKYCFLTTNFMANKN